jgi:hypothetical protein
MQNPYIAMIKTMLRGADLIVLQKTRATMITVKKIMTAMTRVSPSKLYSFTFWPAHYGLSIEILLNYILILNRNE